MHFSKTRLVIVKPDTGVDGHHIGDGYEYRQGDDYMIIPGLQEALYLTRMGYEVIIKE